MPRPAGWARIWEGKRQRLSSLLPLALRPFLSPASCSQRSPALPAPIRHPAAPLRAWPRPAILLLLSQGVILTTRGDTARFTRRVRKLGARCLAPCTQLPFPRRDRRAQEAGPGRSLLVGGAGGLGLSGRGPSPQSAPVGPSCCTQAWGSLWAVVRDEVLYRDARWSQAGRQRGLAGTWEVDEQINGS